MLVCVGLVSCLLSMFLVMLGWFVRGDCLWQWCVCCVFQRWWVVVGCLSFFFQAEDGIRDLVRSRGLGDVYKRQGQGLPGIRHRRDRLGFAALRRVGRVFDLQPDRDAGGRRPDAHLSLIHI